MNKSKKSKKAASKGLAAAYVMVEGSQRRGVRLDEGVDVISDTVLGNSGYTALARPINPGLEECFPALSQEAKRYDCYEFLELSFRFVGTTVISTTVGQIGLAFDPNPHSMAPATQAKFSAYEAHIASSVYKPDGLTLRVPKHMLAGKRYVRYGIQGASLFLYDPGSLIIMVRDEATADPIGYVEVHYKIRFSNFHLEPTASPVAHNALNVSKVATDTFVTATPGYWAFDTCTGVDGLEHVLVPGALTLSRGVYRVTAVLECRDDTSEVFTALATIHLDTVPQLAQYSRVDAATGSTEITQVVVDLFIPLSDTGDIQIEVVLNGAAGTLIVNNTSRLLIQAL
jgi:hypothetical protein